MAENVWIDLTQADIDLAGPLTHRSTSKTCPVARAVQRIFGDPEARAYSLSVEALGYSWSLDLVGRAVIRSYDAGHGARPIVFTATRRPSRIGGYGGN